MAAVNAPTTLDNPGSDWEVLSVEARAFLKLPGETSERQVAVVSAQVNSELNSIPTATIMLAVGRRADNLVAAEIHSFVDKLRLLIPIRLEVRVRLHFASKPAMAHLWLQEDPDFFVLFEGYAVGVASEVNFERATLGLHCVHWLADLSFSSAGSRQSAPTNPTEWSFGLGFRLSTSGARTPYWFKTILQTASLTNDLWKGGLAVWCNELASQDRFFVPGLPLLASHNKNYEALRALQRIEGFPGTESQYEDYIWSRPLSLDVTNANGPLIAASISNHLSQTTAESVATTTLWDKLAGEFAGQFLFGVVPMARRALIVPFIPGLREHYTSVFPYEYSAVHLETELIRPLRGVGVLAFPGSAAGGMLGQKNQKSGVLGAGGYYESNDATQRTGMTHIRGGPAWMTHIPGAFFNAFQAMGGTTRLKGSSASPGTGTATPAEDLPTARRLANDTLWNQYARALYVIERLRGRRGLLQGCFRVDLAPGSTICLQVDSERFVAEQLHRSGLDYQNFLYAHIARLSWILDSESRQALTVMSLSHLRSELENTSDDLSISKHPLYTSIFTGAPYVDRDTDLAPS